MQFSNWKDLKAKGKIADAIVIAVQVRDNHHHSSAETNTAKDHQHVEAVEDFAELGYHILCEKPMATSVADCVKIRNLANATSPKVFGMGHGMRQSAL